MTIKELLAKVAKGETLTDEEKTFLGEYDPEKILNSTAAAARKSAEAKLKDKETELHKLQSDIDALHAEADEKANANKPELEKLQRELDKLKKTLTDKETAFLKLEGEKKQMIRGGKISEILSGFTFIRELNPKIPYLIFKDALAEIKDEDLNSEDLIKPIIEEIKVSNKGIFADTSGGGAGGPTKDNVNQSSRNNQKPVDKMTAEERAADLKKRGII